MNLMAEIFTLFVQLPEDKKEIAIREAQRLLADHAKQKRQAPDTSARR